MRTPFRSRTKTDGSYVSDVNERAFRGCHTQFSSLFRFVALVQWVPRQWVPRQAGSERSFGTTLLARRIASSADTGSLDLNRPLASLSQLTLAHRYTICSTCGSVRHSWLVHTGQLGLRFVRPYMRPYMTGHMTGTYSSLPSVWRAFQVGAFASVSHCIPLSVPRSLYLALCMPLSLSLSLCISLHTQRNFFYKNYLCASYLYIRKVQLPLKRSLTRRDCEFNVTERTIFIHKRT